MSRLVLGQESGKAGVPDEAADVERLCRTAGLGPLVRVRSAHFLGAGDAPEEFVRSGLKHCEALAEAFLGHFRGKGFPLEFPRRRMTVVVLRGRESYAALLGEAPGKDVGGHFDLETNRLVIFDFRKAGEGARRGAERLNLFTLVHESAHLLSFNTGLLDREHVPPLCLSEGLATYVELWQPGARNAIGGINRPRLQALREAEDWIPVADLLVQDGAFQGDREQLAYAEGWLLTQHFLRSAGRTARFRELLAAIRAGIRPGELPAVATRHLGPLPKLDRTLKDEARRYLSG